MVADKLGTDVLDPIRLTDRVANIGVGYLAPDREGGMWVGTSAGLVHVTPQTFRVFSKDDGLPEENVYPIFGDRAGRIWAGIWQSSVVRYEGGRFITVLKTQNPTALFEDRSGRFWIGTIGELYYLDRGRLVRFTSEAGFSGETEISVISQDKDWRSLVRNEPGFEQVFRRIGNRLHERRWTAEQLHHSAAARAGRHPVDRDARGTRVDGERANHGIHHV